jgi:glycosyltransferase involved in cell wall biosynthesis
MHSIFPRLKRKILAALECLRYSLKVVHSDQYFEIISCERNAGDFALKCLDSVYCQKYKRDKVTHIFIDDASDDGTHEKIVGWLEKHPDHRVQYIHNSSRKGGTSNTVDGIKMASDNAIVIELNGDDWLPDPHLLDFFCKIYSDDAIWMTYNSFRNINGPPSSNARKFPKEVIENNSFRDQEGWSASHLHTFRKRLFDHLDDGVFIDPDSGQYWECADDQALYLSMLELAGRHSRHINRITYVYNFWESSHSHKDEAGSVAIAKRIRMGKRFQPLSGL